MSVFNFTWVQKFEPSLILLLTHVGQRSLDGLPQPGVSQITTRVSVDVILFKRLENTKEKNLFCYLILISFVAY